jgi:serine phosphatase RsbU (regulator of sigma subunit)
VLALALDAVIAVIAISTGRRLSLTDLLAAGPLLACARCSGRATALAAVYAISLCAIVTAAIGASDSMGTGYRFIVVGGVGALATFAAAVRSRREGTLISISEKAQRAILHPLPAAAGGVAFASHYQSATNQALVGGDLYDIAMTPFGMRFIIGDVKGQGIDALGRSAAVLAAFRAAAFGEPDLIRLAEAMDAGLSRDMEIEDFVTVIVAEFTPGHVCMVNCGHPPPVKLPAAGGCLQVMTPLEYEPPLGLHPHPKRQDICLGPGDRLLFYTDGLVESRDRAGRFFALDERVAQALAAPDLDTAVRRVVRLLLKHTGDGLADDVLLVLGEPAEAMT